MLNDVIIYRLAGILTLVLYLLKCLNVFNLPFIWILSPIWILGLIQIIVIITVAAVEYDHQGEKDLEELADGKKRR